MKIRIRITIHQKTRVEAKLLQMSCLTTFVIITLFGFLPKEAESQDKHPVDFSAWNVPKYIEANSAQNEDYLTDEEKKVYYYLNLVRMNPNLFAETYLFHIKISKDRYESTLYLQLRKLKPLPVLKPNRDLYESAKCHAIESGDRGYSGHRRLKCKEYFMGECCYYGNSDALTIVLELLIDQGISSMDHRKICLSPYTQLGISIQPHKDYGKNTVLDFK